MDNKRNLIIGALAVATIAAVGYFRNQQMKARLIDVTPENPSNEVVQSQEEDPRE